MSGCLLYFIHHRRSDPFFFPVGYTNHSPKQIRGTLGKINRSQKKFRGNFRNVSPCGGRHLSAHPPAPFHSYYDTSPPTATSSSPPSITGQPNSPVHSTYFFNSRATQSIPGASFRPCSMSLGAEMGAAFSALCHKPSNSKTFLGPPRHRGRSLPTALPAALDATLDATLDDTLGVAPPRSPTHTRPTL